MFITVIYMKMWHPYIFANNSKNLSIRKKCRLSTVRQFKVFQKSKLGKRYVETIILEIKRLVRDLGNLAQKHGLRKFYK